MRPITNIFASWSRRSRRARGTDRAHRHFPIVNAGERIIQIGVPR